MIVQIQGQAVLLQVWRGP